MPLAVWELAKRKGSVYFVLGVPVTAIRNITAQNRISNCSLNERLNIYFAPFVGIATARGNIKPLNVNLKIFLNVIF